MPSIVGFKRGDFEYAEIFFSPSGKAVRRCVDGRKPDVRIRAEDGTLIDMEQIHEYWRNDPTKDRPTLTDVSELWERLKERRAAVVRQEPQIVLP